jgi:hypothetical protein
MKTTKIITLLLGVVLLGTACSDDFFDVKTTQRLTSEDAAKTMEADPSKLAGFVDAIYNLMVQYDLVGTSHDSFGYMAILHATDMMTEDIIMSKLSHFRYDYAHDNREWNYRRTSQIWTYLYSMIAGANNVLGLTDAETTIPEIKAYRGQALALRGLSYYYLIQMYQKLYPLASAGDLPGIPMYFAGNEGKENSLGRTPVKDILAQIEADLTTSVANLQGWTRNNKNQVDYYVANGILARYYLLTEQWAKAEAAAKIAQTAAPVMSSAETLTGFMSINNNEVMWGYDHNTETTTIYASFFSHISNLTAGYAGLNYAPRLIDKRLYEYIPATDIRKKWFQDPAGSIVVTANVDADATTWKLPYANLKFGSDGNFTQDYTYMRGSEMVLIEAEALAHQGKGGEAATALMKLQSKRDPSWTKSTVTVDDVWMLRRVELWGEGFGYYDLKRLNKGIDRNYAGSNHEGSNKVVVPAGDKRWIYKLPQGEIQENTEIDEEDNNE